MFCLDRLLRLRLVYCKRSRSSSSLDDKALSLVHHMGESLLSLGYIYLVEFSLCESQSSVSIIPSISSSTASILTRTEFYKRVLQCEEIVVYMFIKFTSLLASSAPSCFRCMRSVKWVMSRSRVDPVSELCSLFLKEGNSVFIAAIVSGFFPKSEYRSLE